MVYSEVKASNVELKLQVGDDVLDVPHCRKTTFLADRVVGLTAARSRSRSDSPPDCHSLRSRRFATLAARGSKSEVLLRVDCLSVCNGFPFENMLGKF